MPTFRAHTSYDSGFFAGQAVATTCATLAERGRGIHSDGPRVQTAILGAGIQFIVIAKTLGRRVIQILSEPHCAFERVACDIIYFNRLVDLIVARIQELAIMYVLVRCQVCGCYVSASFACGADSFVGNRIR